MNACASCREGLGGYVLGGLEPDEARDVEAHLAQCPGCRAEHAELGGAAGLLALARDAPPEVPRRVRDRIVASAARRRSRRRWALASAAAAVASLLVGLVAGLQLGRTPVEVAMPVESEEPFEVSGWVAFSADEGRVVTRLELEGLEPLDSPSVYEAWLYTDDGRIVSIGQLADAEGAVSTELEASGALSDYRSFWVTAEPDRRDPGHEGPTVVRARVPELR